MAAISRTAISLEGGLGFRDAKSTSQRLADAIAVFDLVEIDVSELAGLDASIVQLLISARRSAEKQGKTLAIAGGTSEIFQAVLVQAGLLGPDGATRSADEEFWLGGKLAERHAA